MKRPANILIIRTDRIGDLVLTVPLAGIIKKHYPESRVSFLVADYTAPLLQNHPDIEDVLRYTNNFKAQLDLVKSKNFDAAILVHPTFELAKLIYKAKIPIRISTGYRWYSFLFTDKVYEHRKYGTKHELEHNVNLLAPLGIKENITPASVHYNIQTDFNSLQKVDEVLESENFDRSKKSIIVHPGSRGSAIDLPESKFKQLIELLARQLNVNIILTGSDSEIDLCKRLSAAGAINLAGRFNLSGLIALISRSDLLIANSTGPIHIAAALGKACVGFYPPVPALSSVRWAPYTEKRKIFTPDVECGNKCTKKECLKIKCMEKINIQEVAQSVIDIINGST